MFLLSEEADDGDLDSLETELDFWDDLAKAKAEFFYREKRIF